MKKRLVFSLVIALVLIVAGVTSVGAYEGYKMNIKAHVETAIATDFEDWELGVLFPQESYEVGYCFGLTESFIAQDPYRVSTVSYKIYMLPKPVGDAVGVCNPVVIDNEDYYQDIYPYLTINMHGSPTPLDPATFAEDNFGLVIYTGDLFLPNNTCGSIHLKFNVPNFPGCWVSETDPKQPWPEFPELVDGEGIWCLEEETICADGPCEFTAMVPHADLGNDLVIQVVDFASEN